VGLSSSRIDSTDAQQFNYTLVLRLDLCRVCLWSLNDPSIKVLNHRVYNSISHVPLTFNHSCRVTMTQWNRSDRSGSNLRSVQLHEALLDVMTHSISE